MIDQINMVHTGVFGWPIDRHTPIESLLQSETIHEATCKLLNTDRSRQWLWNTVPLWPCDKWVCAEYAELRLWVNLYDSYVSRGVLQDAWEVEEVAFVLDQLEPGDAMIDVGANVGVYTLQAARAVGPTGRIYAFEPQTQIHAMLARSIADNGFESRCVLHDFALGDRDGDASIWRHHQSNPGASFITDHDVGDAGNATRVRRLDSLHFDRRVKLLKMDIEGFEPLLVAGGQSFFREHQPIIITEWFPQALRQVAGSSSEEYFDRLTSLNYSVRLMEGSGAGRELASADLAAFESVAEPFNIVCLPR